MQYLLGIMMFLTALFLILLVLIQRGRGGGLAGAFGGAGGQSAFGTKAGDMFTKITIGTAAVWILIAAMSVRLLNAPKVSVLGDGSALPTVISPRTTTDDGSDDFLGGGLEGLEATDAGSEGLGTEAPSTDETEPSGSSEATNGEPAAAGSAAAAESPSTAPPTTDSTPGE